MKMRIVVASVPDRERPVAELWFEDVMWAELNHEDSDLRLQIYSNPTGKPWDFLVDEVLELIEEAKKRV